MSFVSSYGKLWARNRKNYQQLKKLGELRGVYILCDGSLPVYVGRGVFWRRLRRHRASTTRNQFWDYFSWFAIPNRAIEKEVEALLLRLLPYYLRLLNKQRASFRDAVRVKQAEAQPEPVTKPKYAFPRKRRKVR